jgi:hypothetical protein
MKKKRGKTQGKARRLTATDLTARKGGGIELFCPGVVPGYNREAPCGSDSSRCSRC